MFNHQNEIEPFTDTIEETYDQQSSFYFNNQDQNSFTIKLCDGSIFKQNSEFNNALNNIAGGSGYNIDNIDDKYTSTFLIKEGEVTLIYIPNTNTPSSTKQNYSSVENQSQLCLSDIQPPQSASPPPSKSKPKNKANYVPCQPCCLSADYSKNLAGYIFKKIMRLMFSKSPKMRQKLLNTCRKWKVNFLRFRDYYLKLQRSISGPASLIAFFYKPEVDQDDRRMMELFSHLSTKILRGRYLLQALKEGKMKDLKAYIEMKNKYLLYFRTLFP